jgi:hypothetical protein
LTFLAPRIAEKAQAVTGLKVEKACANVGRLLGNATNYTID